MSAASDYLEKEILDHVLGGADYARPATVYFSLFTAAPADAGGGTEVTGGSYARPAITNNVTNFPAAATAAGVSSKENGTTIQFVQATANWGTCTHWGIFDALTAGNLLFHGALTASRSIVSGDTPRFLAAAFSMTCD
jgi:hypothetical protein